MSSGVFAVQGVSNGSLFVCTLRARLPLLFYTMSGTDADVSRDWYSKEAFVPGLDLGASGTGGEARGS